MDEFSEDSRSDNQTVGSDDGVLAGMLEKMRQERDLPMPGEERPVEGQVVAPVWGCWSW